MRQDDDLSAEALRMRASIEKRLFAPPPRLPAVRMLPWRRGTRMRIGDAHEERPRPRRRGPIAIVLVLAVLVAALGWLVLRG